MGEPSMDLENTKISHLSLKKDDEDKLIIKLLENFLLTAKSPEEIKMYLEIYQNIIKQNTLIKVAKNQQFIDRFQIIRQTCIWGVIITIGVALIISRLTIPGLILIGIVFYDFVFDYHKSSKQ
jgi:hypothetical protein